jgi:hypothetical protein
MGGLLQLQFMDDDMSLTIPYSGEFYNLVDGRAKKVDYVIVSDGFVHNVDGPAIIYNIADANLAKRPQYYWYIKGAQFTFEEWAKELKKQTDDLVFLKLKYCL